MGTKTIRLDERVYERIRAHKQTDETFSDTIDRLIGEPSLLELAGNLSEEEAEEAREAIRQSKETDVRKLRELHRRSGDDSGGEA